jgi:hypothetical protein
MPPAPDVLPSFAAKGHRAGSKLLSDCPSVNMNREEKAFH